MLHFFLYLPFLALCHKNIVRCCRNSITLPNKTLHMLGKSLYTCFGAYVGDVGWIVYCFCSFCLR
ncbi:hypothetical protein JHK82_016742 [Glycine max]|nr:hypothetical protein JHK82_016742 [Glycine max]